MVSEERKFQALLRRDFRVFVHKVFATLTPGQTYVPSWHIERLPSSWSVFGAARSAG